MSSPPSPNADTFYVVAGGAAGGAAGGGAGGATGGAAGGAAGGSAVGAVSSAIDEDAMVTSLNRAREVAEDAAAAKLRAEQLLTAAEGNVDDAVSLYEALTAAAISAAATSKAQFHAASAAIDLAAMHNDSSGLANAAAVEAGVSARQKLKAASDARVASKECNAQATEANNSLERLAAEIRSVVEGCSSSTDAT